MMSEAVTIPEMPPRFRGSRFIFLAAMIFAASTPPIPSGAKPSMGGTAARPSGSGGTAGHATTGGTARGGFGSTGHSASAAS